MDDNPHSGHRNRLRKKFIDNGLDGMESHEALELMLYYAIPERILILLHICSLTASALYRLCLTHLLTS